MLGRMAVVLAACVLVVTTLTTPRAQSVDVEITDLKPSPVDYPKGPTIIVRNRTKEAGFQAWVIRHLDGVVVNRYKLPAAERWQEQLEIAPKGVAPPGQAKTGETTVPFAVLVVAASGEVKASAAFDARLSPPKSKWPTAWGHLPTPLPFVASGEVVDMKKTGLTIKDSKGASRTYHLTDDTMTWGGTSRTTDPKPSKGDSVTLIYTDQGGQDVVTQIAYRPAGGPTNPWAPGSAYIGTVKSAPLVIDGGVGFVVETMKYDGQWRIDSSTEKVFSPAVPSVKELKPGVLVGFRVKTGAGARAPVPVDRFFVLTPSGG